MNRSSSFFRVARLLVMLLIGVAWSYTVAGAFEPVVALNDDRQEPLKMVMRQPWYRHTVYRSLPVTTLKLELFPSVHIKPGDLLGCTLRVQVLDGDGTVAAVSESNNMPLSKLMRAEVAIGDLKAGRYRVLAQLFDVVGNPIHDVHQHECRQETTLTIAPPAKHEVVFDQAGIGRVNGERFFPIGMYHYNPGILNLVNDFRRDHGQAPFTLREFYDDARKMGINVVHDGVDGETEAGITSFLERCHVMHEAGIRTLAHVDPRDFRPGTFARVVDNPGLLGWYTFDEPGLQSSLDQLAGRLATRHTPLLELDPHHPQIICDNTISALSIDSDYADVIMPDLYPQRGGDTRVVGRAVRELKRRGNGKTIVWPVIQAFQLSYYGARPNGEPYHYGRLTYDEMRVVVWDAIACGATGLSYYALYTSEGPQLLPDGGKRAHYLLNDFPDQREAITRINQQLGQLIPALLEGKETAVTVEPADSDAHARAISHGDTCNVLVTNAGRETLAITVQVMGLHRGQGRDLYSDAKVETERGRFSVSMEPHSAYVFAFPLSP